MTSDLNSHKDIIEALRNRMRVGEGLSAPYARKWAIGGCEASHSLWKYPHDAISDLANGLTELKVPLLAGNDAIIVNTGRATVWVAVSGNTRNADRAAAFLFGRSEEKAPAVVVNSPEVVIELIRAYSDPPEPIPRTEIIQVGFPGIRDDSRTYVGSWQWNVHGEAQGEEFVCRTANATLAAIRAKEAQRGN
jgi:hypothetical protein